jgi:hypothetical protein
VKQCPRSASSPSLPLSHHHGYLPLLTAMPFIPFKLKKANAPSRFAHFDEQPSWDDLASKIGQLFNIPSDRIGVAVIAKDKEPDILANEQDLQLFYKFLDQSSQEIKFVVQDLQTPDRESAFSLFSSLNTHQPLVYFPPANISYYVSSLTTSLPVSDHLHNLSSPCSPVLLLAVRPID